MANRVLLGRALSGGSPVYGLFVSRPGMNVTALSGELANTRDLLFDSRLPQQANVLRTGSFTMTLDAGDSEVDSAVVYHQVSQAALDYVPVVMIAARVDGSTQILRQGVPGNYLIGSSPANRVTGWYARLFPFNISDESFQVKARAFGINGGAAIDQSWDIFYWVIALGGITPTSVPL